MSALHCVESSRPRSHAFACVSLSLALSLTMLPLAPAFADEAATNDQQQAAQAASVNEGLTVRGVDTLDVSGDAFDVATAVGLGGNTLYADVSVGATVRQRDLPYTYDNATDQAGVCR